MLYIYTNFCFVFRRYIESQTFIKMGVQMRIKTEETAEPLIENNNKDDVEEPIKSTPPQKREILWATAIYLTTWHILAVICTILYWKNVKLMTIAWSK